MHGACAPRPSPKKSTHSRHRSTPDLPSPFPAPTTHTHPHAHPLSLAQNTSGGASTRRPGPAPPRVRHISRDAEPDLALLARLLQRLEAGGRREAHRARLVLERVALQLDRDDRRRVARLRRQRRRQRPERLVRSDRVLAQVELAQLGQRAAAERRRERGRALVADCALAQVEELELGAALGEARRERREPAVAERRSAQAERLQQRHATERAAERGERLAVELVGAHVERGEGGERARAERRAQAARVRVPVLRHVQEAQRLGRARQRRDEELEVGV
mmetsp:Transcript_43155/g.119335  ORF Transcript_43155/g.119335 Transcript_43155/m.119335 type:complete len:278 (+) Transcript_43155:66-899(+)